MKVFGGFACLLSHFWPCLDAYSSLDRPTIGLTIQVGAENMPSFQAPHAEMRKFQVERVGMRMSDSCTGVHEDYRVQLPILFASSAVQTFAFD